MADQSPAHSREPSGHGSPAEGILSMHKLCYSVSRQEAALRGNGEVRER